MAKRYTGIVIGVNVFVEFTFIDDVALILLTRIIHEVGFWCGCSIVTRFESRLISRVTSDSSFNYSQSVLRENSTRRSDSEENCLGRDITRPEIRSRLNTLTRAMWAILKHGTLWKETVSMLIAQPQLGLSKKVGPYRLAITSTSVRVQAKATARRK